MLLTGYGNIQFEPPNVSKKHQKQYNWKRVALLDIDNDLTAYYRWFLKRRFNLILNKPLRGSHITFINDKMEINTPEYEKYLNFKNELDGKQISFEFDVSKYRTDNVHWWFSVYSDELLNLREQTGFNRNPFFDLHLTMGYANERNLEHSEYVKRISIRNGY